MHKESVFAIAKYIVNKYKINSSVKLQKLMYFSYLNFFNKHNKLLFDEKFEAWVMGPVLKLIYLHTRDYGLNFSNIMHTKVVNKKGNLTIMRLITEVPDLKNEEIIDIIDETIKHYGSLTTSQLIELSHKTEPWIKARKNIDESLPSNEKIVIN